MDLLKAFFPLAFKAKPKKGNKWMPLVIALVFYILVSAVGGLLLGLVSKIIPLAIIGFICSLVGSVITLYAVIGIVLSLLVYFKIVK